ncbi:MAG: hypothetical protein ACP5E3_08840, partial [Bacteroidales bacterium]
MKLPKNINLPFFSYGIFKPGQLCYSRIKDLVLVTEQYTVEGYLMERDGVPLLILGKSNLYIKGYIIYFHKEKEKEAYERIIDFEPGEIYRWEQIKVDSTNVNLLVGRREDRGSSVLEHICDWDGSNDPYFKQGLDEVKSILSANSNQKIDLNKDVKPLFRLQMAYILLWSALERYAGLKYHLGEKVIHKIHKIAEEKSFIASLKKNVKKKRDIYSTTNLKKYTLDPNNPKKSIDYYYQVRSNTVHRGKAVYRDFDRIRTSLEELLEIFKDILR